MMIHDIANDDVNVAAITTLPSPSNDKISSPEDK